MENAMNVIGEVPDSESVFKYRNSKHKAIWIAVDALPPGKSYKVEPDDNADAHRIANAARGQGFQVSIVGNQDTDEFEVWIRRRPINAT
jgi:hypothetical protein